MPKLNIVTIYHFDGALHCGFVVSTNQVDFFNAAAVTADNVRLVVRHTGGLRSLLTNRKGWSAWDLLGQPTHERDRIVGTRTFVGHNRLVRVQLWKISFEIDGTPGSAAA
jgi:hypothetical protein